MMRSETRGKLWALVVSAGCAAGAGAQPIDFVVDPARSSLDVELCVATFGCDDDSSAVEGTIRFEFDDPRNPSSVTLLDYQLILTGDIEVEVGNITGRLTATGTGLSVRHPNPGAPIGPGPVAGGVFELMNVPGVAAGTFAYSATGLLCLLVFDPAMIPCSDSVDLGSQGAVTADSFGGSYAVVGDQAEVSSDVSLTVDLFPDIAGSATLTISGTVVGTATIPAGCPADLTGSADPNDPGFGVPDGVADADDFFFYLDAFVAQSLGVCDLTGSSDPNDADFGVPDGVCDADDFFFYLDLFVAGCP